MARKFIIFFLVFFLTACNQKPTLHDLNGNIVDFENYHGKWVVINYWADWCGHCLIELPELNKFYLANQKEVEVFGVNYDQLSVDKLNILVKKLNIQFPNLSSDPAKLLGIHAINTIPATFIIDPQGNLSEPIIGERAIRVLKERTGLSSDTH